MQRQIQEIQALATKYSKADLGRMVQLGLLDPQKAMMAGMMIQRIEQQNAKPPQSTVAQEVLGMPTLASGPMNPEPMLRKPPQLGAPPAPPLMMAAEGGLTTIPADNVGEYAGGGIVAFADGGEADVPGFAAGIPPGLFEALVEAESRGKHSAISNKGARGVAQLMPGTMRDPGYGIKPVRDDSEAENRRVGQEYLSAMLRKYKGNIDNALAAYNWGPGNVDKHLKKYGELTPEKLPKETRNYIPKVKNFLAQQEQRRPEPVRVATNAPAAMPNDMAMDVPAARAIRMQDRTGVPSLLRGPLERVTRLLPSAEAEEMPMIPMDAPAGAMYAGGGIASFRTGGDAEEEFGYYGLPFGGVSGSPEFWERPVMPYGEQMRNVGEALWSGTKRLFSVPETDVKKDKRKEKKEGKAAPVPAAGIRAEPPQPQAYPVAGGWETVTPDQFPLQNAIEMGARRREGFAPAQALPPIAGVSEEGAGAGPTPTMPDLTAPKLGATSFEDYLGKVTPKVGKLDVTQTKDIKTLGAERRQAEVDEGLDPDMFNKMIAGIEAKKGKAATEKDTALGLAIMKAGIKTFGARKGQEFEKLSEGSQEGLNDYVAAVERMKARQEKYDERIEQLQMADATAKRTGLQSDIARRDKLEEMAQNDKRALFNAQNAAANTGATIASTMSTADQTRLVDIWKTQTQAGMQKYVADTQLKIQSEVNNMYKMGMLEANQAKIVMDAAGKFVASNKDNPTYVKDPARLEEDAIAYAYRMAGNLGILPKGATMPEPAKPTEQDYMNRYKIPPVK
jgi:hypothetical protein